MVTSTFGLDLILSRSDVFISCFFWMRGFNLLILNAETNQELIMSQGGIGLLARTADDAEDPQTLRMVAGAIANLCGNGASTSHFLSAKSTRF